MIVKNITGGVTPLKARKSKGKAGKVGKKATATRAQDKSGFSRSDTVDTGKGYKANLESLTAGTSVTSSLADALGAKGPGGKVPGRGGSGTDDFGKIDEFGDVQFQTTPDTKSSGNAFADNCYNTDGSKRHGHSFMYTNPQSGKTYEVACEWDADYDDSGGSHFDYQDQIVKGEHQYRERPPGGEWGPWLPTKGTKYEK